MSDTELRMEAYYYAFDKTGEPAIDRILSAVACAGKAYHHTDAWSDDQPPTTHPQHDGDCPVEWIQRAAGNASDEIARLRAYLTQAEARVAALNQLVGKWLRDGFSADTTKLMRLVVDTRDVLGFGPGNVTKATIDAAITPGPATATPTSARDGMAWTLERG